MILVELDSWIRNRLTLDELKNVDDSLNGVQVGDLASDIQKIGFSVDASIATFKRAADEGADMLFVHHGLFWGSPMPLTGVLGERVRFLMKNELALYAVHLPLDKHAELGNNARIAGVLGLEALLPFGNYKGKDIGVRGRLQKSAALDELVKRLFGAWETRMNVLSFGPSDIRTVGIVSGGAPFTVLDAIEENLDLYITGESSHSVYHICKEAGINVLFAGHYLTEVFGVKAMADAVASELELETFFVDVPTGY